MKRRILSIITALALCLGMCPPVALAAAGTFTMNSDLTINSSNRSQYDNKVITGNTTVHHLTIDGVEVSLTIKDLSLLLDHSDADTNLMHAGIALRNNATLHLTLEGTNKIKGGNGFAAISVPEGCTLEITSASTGSLEVNGGSGGAGIGADWGHTLSSIQTLGSININGGNISARGNLGAAGIGGTMNCWKGSITITGGTVYAEGSSFEEKGVTEGGAGIGGGYYGYVPTINITGGTVIAKAGYDTAACIGAGSYGQLQTGDTLEYRYGNISITDGTVTTDGNIALGHKFDNAAGSITLSTDATLNINNGAVRPMPTGWNIYSMNGRVFDTSITSGQIAARLLIGGRIYDVTIEQDTSQPYCGDFSMKLLLPEASSIEAGLKLGDKTLDNKTVSLSNTPANVTFGAQRYAYYSLDITIYDEKVTGDVEATIRIDGQTVTGQLKKIAEACGKITINKIVLPLDAKDGTPAVTVTAGGNTWNGNASTGTNKTLTIGQPIQPAALKLDLAFGDITFSNNTITYFESAGAEAKTITLVPANIYEVVQSNPETATTNRLNINTPGGACVRIKNVNMKNDGGDYSPIEIAGKVILEISGSNHVTSTTNITEGKVDKGKAAIHVPSGATLELTGTGSLNATVSSEAYYGSAGIGGNYFRDGTKYEHSGDIIIHSGTITAQGGTFAAGIGGGMAGSGTVTINGGAVTASGGTFGAGIGSGGDYVNTDSLNGTVTINGGVVTATGGSPTTGTSGGAGIGGGRNGHGTVTINGGTITAKAGKGSHGIGRGNAGSGGSTTITGGSIKANGASGSPSPLVLSPKNGSGQDLSLVEITLDGVGNQALVTNVNVTGNYGLQDVYTRDGSKLYFYLPDGARPEKITTGGVDYVPESAGSTKYVVDFQVSLNDYPLTKQYDGTPLQEPTASQVESNATDLTFAWYQGETQVSAPVNAGSYTLRVSSGKGSKDFGVEITKRPLTIETQAQTIDYGGSIAQDAYTQNGLAAGDTLNVTLTASQTAPGTYSGAITASAEIMRDSTDATGNYDITYTPGDLTINKIAPTVNSWPTAGAVTYGQTLGDSTLAGGSASVAGTFAWKNGTVKPGAGAAEYDVVFTPADPNYGTVTGKVPVTVQKAALTIKANSQSITYGGDIQTDPAQITASGLADGDTLNAVQVSASASARDVGTYTGGITVTDARIARGGKDMTANYEISYEPGNLTISPLPITVTPDSGQHKEYGAADPALKYTFTPALIGDDKLTGALTYEGAGAETGATGQHKITLGTLSAGENYTLTLGGEVMFEITKPSLNNAEVTLDETSFTYDGTAKTPAVTVKKGDTIVNAGEYDISYSNTNGGANDHTNAGTVTVTITAKESGNYFGSNSTATFTIAPKELTPTITGGTTKTYNGATTCDGNGLSITLEGLLAGDAGNVTATASYVYADKNVGTDKTIHASGITLSGEKAGNYTLSETTAAADVGTITKATVSITWGNPTQAVTYSGAQAAITPPTVSAENSVTVSVTPEYSYAAQDSAEFKDGLPTNAGTYIVRASIVESDNLTAAQADMTLTISPLAITVTPNSDQHKEYGAADPVLTYIVTPSLIGEDTFTGALAYSGANVGEYEITRGTLSAEGNYSITVTPGVKFAITKLTLETAEVTLGESSFVYAKTQHMPVPTVLKNGRTLTENTDYTVFYENNINAGEATVTVTGQGNYCGEKTVHFSITPKELTPRIEGTTTKTYDGTTAAPDGLSITLDGKVGDDDVTATAASYTYNSPNVNDATTITATGIALDGTAKDNYILKTNTAKIAGTITKDTSATAPASNEGYTLDYIHETIAIEQGYEVSTTQTGGTAVTGSISDHLGQSLYIRKVEDSNHAASGWTEFTLAARPKAPALTKTDETLKGQKNGSISNVNAGMEYSVDGGSTWTACIGTEISSIAGGKTVQVRIKAANTVPHGEASTYKIEEGKTITVAFDSQGGSAVATQTDHSYGEKLVEPDAPTRDDHEFQGWYKERDCTTAWDFASDTLTAENVTLYAKWKKVRFTVGGTVKNHDSSDFTGTATVTLMKGSERIDEGTTETNGSFTFSKHIEAGAYNIVTTYAPDGKAPQIKTTLIAITDSDMTGVEVTLPPEGANSQLTVSPGSNTPAVVVGGLDDEAAALKNGGASTVTVSMEVEGKTESQVGATVAEAIKQEAKADSSSGEPMVEYLDISVTKQVDETKEQLTETKNIIEIVVPFDFTGKENIVVLRYHRDTAEKFTEAGDSAKQDKTYKLDKENGYIYIYASKFSTYAVGYTAYHTITFDANGGTVTPTEAPTGSNGKLSTLPTPTWDGYTFKGWYTSADGGVVVTANTAFTGSTTIYAHWEKKSSQGGGGGGGGGWYPSVSYYSVKVNKTEHGTVTASPTSIYSGGTVTLTVKPDEGYQLEKITVTDSQGKAVQVTEKSGKYTFKMPSRDVTIKADFVPAVSPSPSPSGSPTPTTSPSPSPDVWKNPFPDVSNIGWYIKAVEYVCTNGLMAGYENGKFGPNDTLSRAQLAQIIYNKEGRPQADSGRFTDVTTGWYANAVNWAAAEGIVAGVGGGKFAPDQPISRQDLAVMLWRYAGSPEPRKNELDFSDAGKVSEYAWKALCWANENGIVGGKGNRVLDPKGKATRAEAAQMLKNYIEDQKDKS